MISAMMESMAHKCVLLEKTRVPDGAGGYAHTTWTDGLEFKIYPSLDTSLAARVAERDGETRIYSVLVPQEVPVEMGDYYRDITDDGTTYHVTSAPEQKKTPATSMLDLKFFTAEKKVPPTA